MMNHLTIPPEIAARADNFAGRAWLLDEILAWAGQDTGRFLVISGEPGSGKTALAAWLLSAGPLPEDAAAGQKLATIRDLWGAAHFCVARSGRLDPATFAEALARQLAQGYPDFAAAVVEHNDPTINLQQEVPQNWGTIVGVHIENFIVSANPRDGYNRLVRQPLQLLAAGQPNLRLFILVDALDEALTYGEPNIFTLLTESADLPPSVRFLVTTRNVSQIVDKLPGAARYDLSSAAYTGRANEDIATYVRQWQSLASRAWSPAPAATVAGRPELSEVMVEQIVARAEGNFLYARFLLQEFIARGLSLDLSRLPAGLYGLYADYLERIVSGPRATEVGASWLGDYQPILGRLSVALPAAPPPLLPEWLAQDQGRVNRLLNEVKPVTEYDPADEGGYRLYHRSLGDFLATDDLRQDRTAGEPILNNYHTPPATQHEAIINYYLDNFKEDWTACDKYGLRQLATHLSARLAMEKKAAKRRQWAGELYGLVQDEGFRGAQLDNLGDSHATLTDLRTAIETALQRDDLVPVLACIGVYRQTKASRRLSDSIFQAVGQGDFRRAQKSATHYALKPLAKWNDILQLYLAWEAAAQANLVMVDSLVTGAEWLPRLKNNELGLALLVHTAHLLAQTVGQGRAAVAWLDYLAPNYTPAEKADLWQRYGPATPGASQPVLLQAMEYRLRHLLDRVTAGGQETPTLDEETAEEVRQMRHLLRSLAADPHRQPQIDQLLKVILPNAYPRYRDIGLVELGVACLAAPEVGWSRQRLQAILRVGLNVEGVIFTFDLPAILLAEADNPQRAIPGDLPARHKIAAFLGEALQRDDRWGTAMRAQSAQAAAAFWQGNIEEAFNQLQQASARSTGYAGYGSLAFLSLANRCLAFGRPERAEQPIWGPSPPHVDLLTGAANLANDVNNWEFRQERLRLVQTYREAWWNQPAPNVEGVLQSLAHLAEADFRRVYKDYVSAYWLGTSDPAAGDGLKALVTASLSDGTTLDTLLGRLFGLNLKKLSDAQLTEALTLCAEYFTTRPSWQEVGGE
jgi:hypothetical protein